MYILNSNSEVYIYYSIIELIPFFILIFLLGVFFLNRIGNLFKNSIEKVIKKKDKITIYVNFLFYFLIIASCFLIDFWILISIVFHLSSKAYLLLIN